MTSKQVQVSLKCSPEEKALLKKAAAKMGVTMTQFILLSAQAYVAEESDDADMKSLSENVKMIRFATRVLTLDLHKRMKAENKEEEFNSLIEEARGF